MQARDITTKAVISVLPGGKIEDAVRLMRRVGGSDEARRSWWLEVIGGTGETAEDFIKHKSHSVSDVMNDEVISVEEDTPAGDIACLLEKHRIKCVFVLRRGSVVGIVSRENLLHALSVIPSGALKEPTEDDRVLRARVDGALKEVPGATVNLINYTVDKGNVAIWGVSASDFEETAIRVAVENVPDVNAVKVQMGRLPAWG